MTGLGAAALATTIGASHANADCDISIGAMGSGESITAVATFVLEVSYGCNVSVVPTDTIPAVISGWRLSDIVPEVWRNSAQAYGGLEDAGKVMRLPTFSRMAVKRWWIPTWLAENTLS